MRSDLDAGYELSIFSIWIDGRRLPCLSTQWIDLQDDERLAK